MNRQVSDMSQMNRQSSDMMSRQGSSSNDPAAIPGPYPSNFGLPNNSNNVSTRQTGQQQQQLTLPIPAAQQAVVAAPSMQEFCIKLSMASFAGRALSVTLTRFDIANHPLIGCSMGFLDLTGLSSEGVIGKNCRFLNVGLKLPLREKLRHAIQTGTPFMGVLQNLRHLGNGDFEMFSNLLHLVLIVAGTRRYILGFQVDVSGLGLDLEDETSGDAMKLQKVFDSVLSGNVESWIQFQEGKFQTAPLYLYIRYYASGEGGENIEIQEEGSNLGASQPRIPNQFMLLMPRCVPQTEAHTPKASDLFDAPPSLLEHLQALTLPMPSCFYGKSLVITSHRNENLHDNEGIVKLHTNTFAWEQWTISDAGNGKVFIKSHRNENLQDNNGNVKMHPNTGAWERWTISDAGNGTVSIKSHRNENLQDNNGVVLMHSRLGEWDQWKIRDADEIRVEVNPEAAGLPQSAGSERYGQRGSLSPRGNGGGPRVSPIVPSVLCLADALSDDSRSPSKQSTTRTGRQQQLALNPEANNWTSTIKNQLRALNLEDPACVLSARGISKLGMSSASKLRDHFSQFGQVKAVHVPLVFKKRSKEPRSAGKCFIVMDSPQTVERILSQGNQETVDGVVVLLECFNGAALNGGSP